MQNKNKVSKLAWDFFEATKEITKKNFVVAINTKQLNIEENMLPAIFTLIDSSIKEGFNKGHNSFLNSVTAIDDQEKKKK